MKRQIAGSSIVAAMLFGSIAPAAAKPPSDISDLPGSRAAGAETAMESRGYEMTKTSGGAQYWWNSGTKTCVSVVVSNGRYANVDKTDSSNCGHGGGGSAAAAVGAIAAVGLIAALASHKKKHGDSDANHDSEYSRGYNDGLYGGQYDRNDSEGYHDGFMAGEAAKPPIAAPRTAAMPAAAPMRHALHASAAPISIRMPPAAAASRSASAVPAAAIMSSRWRPAIIVRPARLHRTVRSSTFHPIDPRPE